MGEPADDLKFAELQETVRTELPSGHQAVTAARADTNLANALTVHFLQELHKATALQARATAVLAREIKGLREDLQAVKDQLSAQDVPDTDDTLSGSEVPPPPPTAPEPS